MFFFRTFAIFRNFISDHLSRAKKKNLPLVKALHHRAQRIPLSCVSIHIHEFVSRTLSVSRRESKIYQFPRLLRSFCRLRSPPRRSLLVRCFIDRGRSIKSRDPSSRLPSLLLLYFAVVQSFPIPFFFSRRQAKKFLQQREETERRPHSRV